MAFTSQSSSELQRRLWSDAAHRALRIQALRETAAATNPTPKPKQKPPAGMYWRRFGLTGWALKPIGWSPTQGCKWSEETKQKQSLGNIGKHTTFKRTDAAKRKIARASRRAWRNAESANNRMLKMAEARERPETKERFSQGIKRSFTPERREQYRRMLCESYAVGQRTPSNVPHPGYHGEHVATRFGTLFASSSWEAARLRFLDKDASVVRLEKEPFVCPYSFEGRLRNYFPDFLVERVDGSITIEEVKGWRGPEWAAKERAVKRLCKRRGYTFRLLDSLEVCVL